MKNTEDKPATFILKLSNILRSKEHARIISWDHEEKGIRIHNQEKLEQSVLPRFFRHNKFASFVRQLNMYNFHKLNLPDHTNIFYHEKYNPKDKENLHLIRRKTTFFPEECQFKINNPKQEVKSAFRLSMKGPLGEKSIQDTEQTPEQVLRQILEQLAPLQLSQESIKSKIAEFRKHKKFRRFLRRGHFVEKLYARLGIEMDNNEDKLSELSIQEQLMYNNTKKSLTLRSLKMYQSGHIYAALDSLGALFQN